MTTWNGKRVRDLRKRMGLTQQRFAEEILSNQSTINNWETDTTTPSGPAQKLLSIMEEKSLYGSESL